MTDDEISGQTEMEITIDFDFKGRLITDGVLPGEPQVRVR